MLKKIAFAIKDKLGKEDSLIVKSAISLVFFVGLTKFAGALKEMVFAWKYGVSPTLDAYSFNFTMVQWPIGLFESVLTATLIPLVSKIRHGSEKTEQHFRAELLFVTIVLGVIIAIIYLFIFRYLLEINIFGLSSVQLNESHYMLKYMVWLIPIGFLIALFSAWTMAGKRHINTFFQAIPSLSLVVFVIWLGNSSALIYGVLSGFFIQAISLIIVLNYKKEIELPSISIKSKHWSLMVSGFKIMLIGQFFMSFIGVADKYFAAGLGEGALSILNYSDRVVNLGLGLGTLVIGRAILPVFSDMNMKKDSKLRKKALQMSTLFLLVGAIIVLFVSSYSTGIIELIFERGSFTSNNTKLVSNLFSISIYQIPFYLSGMVLAYTLKSMQKYKELAIISFICLITKISLIIFLIEKFELEALVLSTVGVYVVSFIMCLIVIWRK